MATERLPMRKTREILRLKWELRLSNRDAARSVGVSPGTVVNVLSRAATAGIDGWASVESMSEEEIEARFYQRPQVPIPSEERAEPDCAWIHRELRRPGVTLELLHHEYLEQHPTGLRYSAFCDRYRVFRERRRLSMRQHHVAGDKMFVDYSDRGRDGPYGPPPAQIRASGITALGSHLGFDHRSDPRDTDEGLAVSGSIVAPVCSAAAK